MRAVAAESTHPQPAVERLGGVGPDRGEALAFSLAANASHAGAEIEIAVVDADQFADPEAGGVHGLEDRPIAQAERFVRRGGLEQAADILGREEMGQSAALPRIAQRLGGVFVDPSFPLAETVKAAEAGQSPGDRRLGITCFVQRAGLAAEVER